MRIGRQNAPESRHGGATVSWIDDDKSAEDERDNRRKINDELRLHKARLLAAKAPKFLSVLFECLRTDCADLFSKFSGNLEKQCSYCTDTYTHSIQGCKLPWKVLKMQPNIQGHCIDLAEGRRESRDREVPVGPDQIRITVNQEDELELYFRGVRYLTPDALSEALIRYVRGN
jgi:hypothetical protein